MRQKIRETSPNKCLLYAAGLCVKPAAIEPTAHHNQSEKQGYVFSVCLRVTVYQEVINMNNNASQ